MRYWSILVAALCLALAAAAPRAWADCYESCQGSCKDMSGHINDACVSTCSRAYCSGSGNSGGGGSRPYGSIAFALGNGAEGISWGKGSKAEADRSALATCSRYGAGCRIVYQYWNTCAALSVARGAQHYAATTGNNKQQAEASSLSQCQRSYGECMMDLSACSP
jgi:hypothetical protein